MFGNSIKSMVNKVMTQRIAEAQKKHDEECRVIDQEAETKKVQSKMAAVESIVGKFL